MRMPISSRLAARVAGAAALASLAAPTAALAADNAICVDEKLATDVATVVLPDALNALGKVCANALPPGATLRAGLPALTDRARIASDAAWGTVRGEVAKLAGDQIGNLDPEFVRPLVGAAIGAAMAGKIKPADCAKADAFLGTLAPLPPENMARLIVLFLEVGSEGRKNNLPFRICPNAAIGAAR